MEARATRQQLAQYIEESQRIVFFGGAGISTESGIPDFRSVDGLYHQSYQYPPETILSHSFFLRQPEDFFRYYRDKMLFPDAAPGRAHLALTKLEAAGKLTAVVTQNIDGLHQLAGSKTVLELHGSTLRNYCMGCGRRYGLDAILENTGIPRCACGSIIRPDVVLYGESLDTAVVTDAELAIRQADMLIVGGTSLAVYPAAGMVQYYRGNRLVLINKTPTPMDRQCKLVIHDSIGETLSFLL